MPAPVPYANLTNPQTLNLYAMVSDNPETFADLDGHSAEGATEQSDTLAEDGDPAACARLLGCAEYEVQYADGPLDTSQAQNNADARADSTVDGTQQQSNITYANKDLQTMFENIAAQSPTFAAELSAASTDSSINSIKVQEPGVTPLPDHAPADTAVTTRSDGKVDIVITVRRGDERNAEHEMGHVHDVRTNRDQFLNDAKRDAKNKGGPSEVPHDDRPVEKRANQFAKLVEQERKLFRKENQP